MTFQLLPKWSTQKQCGAIVVNLITGHNGHAMITKGPKTAAIFCLLVNPRGDQWSGTGGSDLWLLCDNLVNFIALISVSGPSQKLPSATRRTLLLNLSNFDFLDFESFEFKFCQNFNFLNLFNSIALISVSGPLQKVPSSTRRYLVFEFFSQGFQMLHLTFYCQVLLCNQLFSVQLSFSGLLMKKGSNLKKNYHWSPSSSSSILVFRRSK